MKYLLLSEYKKFLQPWHHRFLILFVLAVPFCLLFLQHYQNQYQVAMLDGKKIVGSEVMETMDQIRQEMAGEVNEEWLTAREQQLIEYKDMDENDIRLQTIQDAYWDGVNSFEGREYVLQDVNTPKQVIEDLNQHPLQYGPYEGWLAKMNSFQSIAVCYLLVCIFLFSNMFNQEESYQMMDLLKSSCKGRKAFVASKVMVTVSIALCLGIGTFVAFEVASAYFLPSAGNTTTVMMLKSMQFYTFEEVHIRAFWLLLIGGLATSILSLFLSLIFKKTTQSLGVSCIFYVLPTLGALQLFSTALNTFFPSVFVNVQWKGQMMMTPWLVIGKQVYHHVPVLGILWFFISSLCVLGVFWLHCSNKIQSNRKWRTIWNLK